MPFDLIESTAEHVRSRCSKCGLDVISRCKPSMGRVQAWRQLVDQVGCNCPIEEGGSPYMRKGMVVYHRTTGDPRLVVDVDIPAGAIRTLTKGGSVSRWDHVYVYTRKRPGLIMLARSVVPDQIVEAPSDAG